MVLWGGGGGGDVGVGCGGWGVGVGSGLGSGRLQGRDGGGSVRTLHSAPDGDTGELQLWPQVGWWSEMEGAEKPVPA